MGEETRKKEDSKNTQPKGKRIEELPAEEQAWMKKVLSDPGVRMIQKVANANEDPQILILVAHGFIELMINELIKKHAKNASKIVGDSRGFPHSTKLILLYEMGILDERFFRLFDWFRKLRNDAAHQPLFELTNERLQEVNGPTVENFHWLVKNLTIGFWNEHPEVFHPAFMPSQHPRPQKGGG